MPRFCSLRRIALLLVAAWAGQPLPTLAADDPYAAHIAPTGPRTPEEERQGFRLPPGFEIQLVASEPAIRKPMNLAFDDRGRLWLTDTVEYPFPAPPDRPGRDTVKVLEDTDGDGHFDKVITFADGLNIPIGLLPLQDGCLVFSIPNIYRLTDTDGDGKADRRQVLVGRFGFQDTHGLTSAFTWGFDGWVYACHGFANESHITAADGRTLRLHSGNTYRLRPDGSRVEQFTHGQVNPFGLAFDPLGNLFSADCHTRPVMMLLRTGWYDSFGKPHDGLGYAPEMCFHDHGSTGIAGIAYYAADQFPPAYRDTLFIGNVITNRINHDRLHARGSTLLAVQQPDFLISEDPWFRPVDIKLGPDGALYVADFYNRIIGHYEVPLHHPGRDRERGRIWRIVYRGPGGQKEDGERRTARRHPLLDDLAHPNLTVRMLATNRLVEHGGPDVVAAVRSVLHPRSHPWQRVHGLWVLQRLGTLDEATLAAAIHDSDRAVRVHALRVLAERSDWTPSLRRLALDGLRDTDPFAQRAAAEALSLHPATEDLRPLLDLRHTVPAEDTQLLHTVRMALRDHLRTPAAWSQLPTPLSQADARALADVAPGIPSAEAAAFLLAHVRNHMENTANLARYVRHIARHGKPDTEPQLLTFAQANRPEDLRHQAALLRAVQEGLQQRGAKPSPACRQWGLERVNQLLASRNSDLIHTGIDLAGALRLGEAQERLATLAASSDQPESLRRAALSALVTLDGRRQVPLLATVLGTAAEPMGLRMHAAHTLAVVNSPESRSALAQALATAPAQLESVIAAELAASRAGAELLLEAVGSGKASARTLQSWPVVLRLQSHKLPRLPERLAELTRGLPPADQRLQQLLDQRRAGFAKAGANPARGAAVFEKHCAACHQLGGKGAKIGPQLDGIGIRGLDRLLEDTLDPNRNVDQAFRATTIVQKNGQVQTGLVLREEGAVLILADAQGKEVRIPKDAIEERVRSPLSPMPANWADQIPEDDFHHLLAYLLAQRPSPDHKPGPDAGRPAHPTRRD